MIAAIGSAVTGCDWRAAFEQRTNGFLERQQCPPGLKLGRLKDEADSQPSRSRLF